MAFDKKELKGMSDAKLRSETVRLAEKRRTLEENKDLIKLIKEGERRGLVKKPKAKKAKSTRRGW